jgi:hypothetical protein
MNLQKDLDRLVQGVTSSPSKKKVIKQRIEDLLKKVKKYWYSQLLVKLKKIKDDELSLDDYIKEVEEKINT